MNMSRSVSRSVATAEDGITQPDSVRPVADSNKGGKARVVGEIYRGNGYGDNTAWMVCDKTDLVEITR